MNWKLLIVKEIVLCLETQIFNKEVSKRHWLFERRMYTFQKGFEEIPEWLAQSFDIWWKRSVEREAFNFCLKEGLI